MSGSGVGLSGSARYFVSATVPTISSQGLVGWSWPLGLIRLPIGFWFGQNRFARLSLTMTTELVGVRSASLNVRPAVTGIRIVSKNVGLTRCQKARGAFWASVVVSPSAW